MPVLARFYGLIIKMYFQQAEHNPPHIHALYDNQYMGVIDIHTRQMIEGDLPARALKMVAEWTEQHENELLAMWETQDFKQLPPLD